MYTNSELCHCEKKPTRLTPSIIAMIREELIYAEVRWYSYLSTQSIWKSWLAPRQVFTVIYLRNRLGRYVVHSSHCSSCTDTRLFDVDVLPRVPLYSRLVHLSRLTQVVSETLIWESRWTCMAAQYHQTWTRQHSFTTSTAAIRRDTEHNALPMHTCSPMSY